MLNDIRSQFSRVLSREEIYLANHSLGRPPDKMALDVAEAVDLWYSAMDDAWTPWMAEMNRWRQNVAKVIGAKSGDRIVPKTSAGQGLRAVLNAFPQERPVSVITTRGEFDSIDFILKAYSQSGRATVEWIDPSHHLGPVPMYTSESIVGSKAFRSGPPGLIVVSLVFFGTSQILPDADALVAEAHKRGWCVLLDLYHAAGVIPLDFDSLGADFGIGGSYKYLRGGPGACYLALGSRGTEPSLRSLDTGWFAKRNTFGYDRPPTAEFADGGDGWLESTPPILMPYQARAGIEFTLEVGVSELREHSLGQQARMREIFRSQGVSLFEPTDATRFGAYSLLRHSDAAGASASLKRLGVNTDARGEFVRFGPDVLTTDDELHRAARITAGGLAAR